LKKRHTILTASFIAAFVVIILFLSPILFKSIPVKIKTTINKRTAYIGNSIKYMLIISSENDAKLDIPDIERGLTEFTIRSKGDLETMRSGMKIIEKWYVLTLYEPGEYTIPSFNVGYKDQKETQWHQVKTKEFKIRIKSLISKDLGKEASLKKEDASIVDRLIPGRRRVAHSTLMSEKNVPIRYKIKEITKLKNVLTYRDIILIAILSLLGIVIFVLLIVFIWRKIKTFKPPTLPPDEIAMEALKNLKASNRSEVKYVGQFYEKLFSIIKTYIKAKFKINVVEMTTKEFISEIYRVEDLSGDQKNDLKGFIELCDTIKYSGKNVSGEKALEDLEFMREFVKTTSKQKNESQNQNAQ